MKILTNILAKIDNTLTRGALSYINKVSHTLYPKTYLEDEDDDGEDNEPILFI